VSERTYITVIRIKRIRVRPRVPSKLAGRRGTRRAYKRANPPRWFEVADGNPMLMSVSSPLIQALRNT
jgi:hypothetical protein